MVSKRQVRSMLDRAVQQLPRPSVSRDSYRNAWRNACFEAVQELMLEPPLPTDSRLKARAMNMIRKRCEMHITAKNQMQCKIRAGDGWEAYGDEVKNSQTQDELLCLRLPELVWQTASELVSVSAKDAIAWIHKGGYELFRPTVDHLHEIAILQKLNTTAQRRMNSASLTSSTNWHPIIRTAGGANYFLCYTVAVAMADQLIAVACVVQGLGIGINPFASAEFFNLVSESMHLWTNRYQPLVIAYSSMPETHRPQFVTTLAEQRKAIESTIQSAKAICTGAERQQELLERQVSSLLKRATTAEEKVSHMTASYDALLEKLHTTAARTAVQSLSDGSVRKTDALEMRDKDAQIGNLQKSLAESRQQLTFTRELLTVLLEPAPGTSALNLSSSRERDPETWRIVFVGGHERLHAKLRKRMRNSVFLHPDRSQFSSEAFAGVDAVVFSIGYCSHALAYRAADEVRRRGLPAGYSHFTNVDIVLDEVRAILFKSWEKSPTTTPRQHYLCSTPIAARIN